MAMLNVNSDVIFSQLEKWKPRLGPLYQPLYVLTGAVAFILLFCAIIGLPFSYLDDFKYIIFFQFLLLVTYFVMLLAIQTDVFLRFVYSSILLFVASSAAVSIMHQGYFNLLTSAMMSEQPELPKLEFLLHSLQRGALNSLWALPLIALFTFLPKLKENGAPGLDKAYQVTLGISLAFHLGAMAWIFWWDAVIPRVFASLEGASEALRTDIEPLQWAFLIFESALALVGLLVLGVAWRWRRSGEAVLHAIIVGGLLLSQLTYAGASSAARELNLRYPASRSTSDRVGPFRSNASPDTVVFSSSFFIAISPTRLADHWQPFSICRNPESGKFTYEVLSTQAFRRQYREANLARIRTSRPEALFCQERDGE